MKYYIDVDGNYLGGWDQNPPESAIEVPFAPEDARQKWIGNGYSPVPIAVPQQITVRQAKLEMIEEGIYSQLLEYKASLPEKEQLVLEAELSGNFMERDSPVVLQIAQLLGISEEQLDQLFINAEKR